MLVKDFSSPSIDAGSFEGSRVNRGTRIEYRGSRVHFSLISKRKFYMIDIKLIRENPNLVKQSEKKRGKNIKIVDVVIHRSSKAPMVYYEVDFKELGEVEGSITLWPGATKQDVRQQLKQVYRQKLKLLKEGVENLSDMVSEEMDVA